MSIDSNWANGLVNIQNGWEAIKKGRCDTAIVSTANIQSNAEITIQLNDMGFLSPNGICNSFDDSGLYNNRKLMESQYFGNNIKYVWF